MRLAREQRPELIVLDLDMPRKGGAEVLCELRRGIQTRSIPVVMLTGSAGIEDKVRAFELGADDYITKPFDTEELAARVEGQMVRSRRALSADALTRLPGSPMIEEEVKRRIALGTPFSFLRADIDNFGAFNEACGYELGDELLLGAAGALLGALAVNGLPDDFAGHAGGDDFVAVTVPERAEAVARAITEGFDKVAARFFLLGAAGQAEMPRLSVGVASSVRRRLDHYGKAVEIAAELLCLLKRREQGPGSAYLLDRRSEFPALRGVTGKA